MSIFTKCMQKLWHSARSNRLYQSLITATCMAIFFGMVVNHNRQKITFVKERKVVLSFDLIESISIPLVQVCAYNKIPFLEFSSHDEKWRTTAIYTQSVGELMAGLTSSQKQDSIPLIAFVQDVHGDDYVIIIGKNKESSLSSLQFLVRESLVERKALGKEKYLGIKLPNCSSGEGQIAFYIQQQQF